MVAEDVGTSLNCAVTAEGAHTATSWWVYPTWEPLRLNLLPDADATGPNAFNAYTLRLRNDNPVAVTITTLELTMPGGFSYRAGTTTGALNIDPSLTGPGSLTLRWTQDFDIPATAEAVVRAGVTAGSALGDFLASARAYPASSAFSAPPVDRTARVTVEGGDPAAGACTISGTANADVLNGTPGPDVICGLGGDDVVRGLGGDDELWGGPGDDRLDGGDGADALRGGDGADVLDGEAGADVMRGGGGLDTVSYAARLAPVASPSASTEGDDGEAGEGDTVSSDVEIVRGGRGNDTLDRRARPGGALRARRRRHPRRRRRSRRPARRRRRRRRADRRRPIGRPHLLRRRDRPLQRRHPGPDRRLRTALRDRGDDAMTLRNALAAAALAAAALVPTAQAAKPRADLSVSQAARASARSRPAAS